MMIIPLYGAGLALFFIGLSVRTLRLRRRLRVAVGSGDEPLLERAIRAHANCAEYVPLTLLVLFFLELQARGWWIHVLGALLVLGRFLHAYGLSQVREDFRFRVAGMAMTFSALGLGALGTAAVTLLRGQ